MEVTRKQLEFWEEKRERGGVVLGVLTCAMIGPGCSPWNLITLWLNLILDADSGVTLGSVFACKTESFTKKAQGEGC